MTKERAEAKKLVPKKPLTKPVEWCSEQLKKETREDWPQDMREEVGHQLWLVQTGKEPDDFKTMTTIGTGVFEIRLQDENKSQYRLIYVVKFADAIYVLHVITKKATQQTNDKDLEQARRRLSEVERQQKAKLDEDKRK